MRAGLQVSRNTTVRLMIKRDTVKSLHMRRGGPTSSLCLRRCGKAVVPVHRPHVGDVKVVRAHVRLRENSLHKTFMHAHAVTLQC